MSAYLCLAEGIKDCINLERSIFSCNCKCFLDYLPLLQYLLDLKQCFDAMANVCGNWNHE